MDAETRRFVRERAARRCEYCRFSEAALPYLVFHVDHIVARQHLEIITDAPEGLAWACSECNFHKGPNLASIDPLTGIQVNLFNPRQNEWLDHFTLQDGKIVGTTAQGRATARLLNMNAPRVVRLRRELISLGEFPEA